MKRSKAASNVTTIDVTNLSLDERLRVNLEAVRTLRHEMARSSSFSGRFVCNEDLILRHGRSFQLTAAPGPRSDYQADSRSCFVNTFANAYSPWVYVEGYAMFGSIGLAVHHAWLTDEATMTMAIDPTWEFNSVIMAEEPSSYLGLAFKRSYVDEVALQSTRSGGFSLLDCPERKWPLLTGKVRIEDVLYEWRPVHRSDQPERRRRRS